MLRLPAHYEDTTDEEARAKMREQVERSAVQWAYEADTKEANPLLDRAYNLWQGRTRQETVAFATNTWDGDILPFRESLMRLAR